MTDPIAETIQSGTLATSTLRLQGQSLKMITVHVHPDTAGAEVLVLEASPHGLGQWVTLDSITDDGNDQMLQVQIAGAWDVRFAFDGAATTGVYDVVVQSGRLGS